MGQLVAIAYPDMATAMKVRDRLFGLQRENLVVLEDAAIVERKATGKIKLHQVNGTVAVGAAGGALWGGLIGLLFLVPTVAMALPARPRAVPDRAVTGVGRCSSLCLMVHG